MNKSGDENRSVRNTKKRLKEGLLQLLAEKSINQITVRELTELVDINRGTFYFHYTDIYDMLHQIEDDFFAQFESVLNQNITQNDNKFPYLTEVFTFIKDNQEMTKILLGQNTDIEFILKLKQLLHQRSESYWQQVTGDEEQQDLPYYSAFIIAGCVGVIKRWLDEGFEKTPEEVSELAGTIIEAGLAHKKTAS